MKAFKNRQKKALKNIQKKAVLRAVQYVHNSHLLHEHIYFWNGTVHLQIYECKIRKFVKHTEDWLECKIDKKIYAPMN